MDYLLLSEAEARSVDLTQKQLTLRRAVSRVLADEEPLKIATQIIEEGLVSPEEIVEMISWIKENQPKRNRKSKFAVLSRQKRAKS